MKVVILEDEELIAEKLRIIIESNGHNVIAHFDNAEDLLSTDLCFDLALLDINLSGNLDGIDFVHKYPHSNQIAYIYISDIEDSEKIDRASTTNPVSYLSKPYKKKDLTIALKLAEQRVGQLERPIQRMDITLIKDADKLINIDMENLLYIEGQGSYSQLVMSGFFKNSIAKLRLIGTEK